MIALQLPNMSQMLTEYGTKRGADGNVVLMGFVVTRLL